MILVIHPRQFLVILLIAMYIDKEINGSQTFVVSFQPEIKGSFAATTDSWMEISTPISSSKEFTVCNWLKIKYFAINIPACPWAYCTFDIEEDEMKCTQMWFEAESTTANRNLRISLKIQLQHEERILRKSFDSYYHRTWFHVCWSWSTITGISKFYLNGDVLAKEKLHVTEKDWALYGSDKKLNTSLIVGQEPDSFRGGFDKQQAYIGSLSEFNIWNYTLMNREILDMARCREMYQGNILSWKDSSWILNGVFKDDNFNMSDFCFQKTQYFIIPEKLRYAEARKNCETHGGSLALPRSENELKDILEVVNEHGDTCIGNEILLQDSATWIGAKKFNYSWHEIGSSMTYESAGSPLNYTKTTVANVNSNNTKCAYIRSDGGFMGIYGDFGCDFGSLCTVCEIRNQPAFTLKGVCDLSDIDWIFYLSIDKRYQIVGYEGYKKNDIVFDVKEGTWNIVPMQGYTRSFNASFSNDNISTVSYPIGRKNWNLQDTICQIRSFEHSFTISVCKYPTEFTCDSGYCIEIDKRCDEKMDCLDESDEKHCNLIEIPPAYRRSNAPESPTDSPMTIKIQSRIISIDSIDTVNMVVSVTMELKFKWYDKRLTFSNPEIHKRNLISNQETDSIWTPLRDIIHENAIIGEVLLDNNFAVQINASYAEDLNPKHAIENRLFNGSSNYLIGTQRMKAKYNCKFEAKKFPFDEHNCSIILRIDHRKDKKIHFLKDGEILYEGENVVGQFLIGLRTTEILNTNESTKNIVTIHMVRLYANQITITFVPTLVLWLFGYTTLLIEPNEDGFSDRFIGAGTALLVIVTLLNAIHTDLPKTSYMKYIDLWFMYHVISIFLMIAYHIVLNRLRLYFNSKNIYKWSMTIRINYCLIIVFPIVNGIFYAIYFSLTL